MFTKSNCSLPLGCQEGGTIKCSGWTGSGGESGRAYPIQPLTFRRFCRKGYAIFASLHREIRIGVLTVGTLGSVILPKVQAAGIATHPMTDDEGDDKELSELTVSGTLSPLTALQSARIVGVITCQQIEAAAAQSVNDLLKLAVGVDVRQRGGFGIQSDISINGGTFDQITLLLNGVNISSPHTGHLAADFPVSLSDIERIEVLEGAASRVYGASAFGGAINIVTKKEDSPLTLQDSPPALPVLEGSSVSSSRAREGADTKRRQLSIEGGVQGGSHGTVGADTQISFEGGVQGGSYGTIGGDMRLSIKSSKVTAPSLARLEETLDPSRTGRAGGESSGGESSNSFLSLSSTFQRSDGATVNSDFQRGNAYLRGVYETADYSLDLQAGYSQKSYGANTFYSAAYPYQFERNRRFIVSAGAETRGRLRVRPEVYWNRLYDNFELIRGTRTGENFHRTDVYGSRVTAGLTWAAGRTSIGAEVREEAILSTSLGKLQEPVTNQEDRLSAPHVWPREGELRYDHRDSRTNLSFNAEHTLLLPRFTVSAGLLANMNTRFDDHLRLYPGIDLAYTPAPRWRLFASYNKGFRLPTFTDLYYKSPTHEGNAGMHSEESHSVQVGSKMRVLEVSSDPGQSGRYTLRVDGCVKGFYHRGTNLIDWVMYSADDVYHSTNFNLDNLGIQTLVNINLSNLFSSGPSPDPSPVREGRKVFPAHPKSPLPNRGGVGGGAVIFQVSYAFIHQNRRDNAPVYKSNYAMEYLRHKVVCTLDHPIVSRLTASWAWRWQDRVGSYLLYEDGQNTGRLVSYTPYSTLDVKLRWHGRRFELWAEGTNLTNRHYYDLGNIPQPGLQVMGGLRLRL